MGIKKPSKLKKKIIELNKTDPWTLKERKKFVPYERSFIRIAQIKNKKDKKWAIGWYMDYLHKSKEQTRKIRTELEHFIRETSPKKGIPIKISHSQKHNKPAPSKKSVIKFSKKYDSYEDYLRRHPKPINRIIKAHKKYPHDSLYQLQHGHYAGGGK